VAREQLVEHGAVVTFRTRDRTTGETWWRESRNGRKRGDCTVKKIGAVTFGETRQPLFDHVGLSGFASVDAWLAAIGALHGGVPDRGWLFRVQAENSLNGGASS
jgi:hypothetical protein